MAADPTAKPSDNLARWRKFTHRGTTIAFVPSGIVVTAATPEELVAATDAEILLRLDGEPEN